MSDLPQGTEPWSYKLVSMGNPLGPDVEERANAFGRQGWELVAIDAGVWVFKRRTTEEGEPLRALMEETVAIAGTESESAVSSRVVEAPATRTS